MLAPDASPIDVCLSQEGFRSLAIWWYLEQDSTSGLDISSSTLRVKRLSIAGKRRNQSILHRVSFIYF